MFLGHYGGHDIDGNELPRLMHVSREKRHGFNHHKKSRAMNVLVSVIFFPIHSSFNVFIILLPWISSRTNLVSKTLTNKLNMCKMLV
jgi:hypothetical protein